jgi:hypothetical protein
MVAKVGVIKKALVSESVNKKRLSFPRASTKKGSRFRERQQKKALVSESLKEDG